MINKPTGTITIPTVEIPELSQTDSGVSPAAQINPASKGTAGNPVADGASVRLPAPAGHLDYIDGFRGIAILLVLFYHTWEAAHLPAAYWWNPLFSGYTGVSLFLVLSGFCLYWPMVRPIRASPEPTLAEFAWRRAHRLLPPYYIALFLFGLTALLWNIQGGQWQDGPNGGPKAILTTMGWHLLLLQNLRPEHIFTLDGPMWSLALEVSLYVGMPLLVVLARRRGIGAAVTLAAVVTISYRIACDRLMGGSLGWRSGDPAINFVLINFLPGQWVEFALGMWAAALISRGSSLTSQSPTLTHRNATWQNRFPLGGAALVLLVTAAWLSQHFTRYNPFSDSLYGVGYFLLILIGSKPLHAGDMWRGGLGRVVRWRPLVWLGQISYSVYLIHEPLMHITHAVIRFPQGHDRTEFLLTLLLLVPIVGVSYLFHLGCERPFLNRRPPARPQEAIFNLVKK